MKKLHLFKLLFGVMLVTAATAFTGCSNDDDDDVVVPTLEVSPTSLTFDENGGAQMFSIKTTGKWVISGVEGEAEKWLGITPALTGTGDQTITVTVADSDVAHKAELKVTIFTTIYGIEKEVTSKTVTINQTSGGVVPVDEVIWAETCGTDGSASDKPFVADYTGWNKTGVGASTVTYSGTNTSVRSSGLKNDGSGHNEIFFGGAPATFVVNKITLTAAQTKLQLSFIGSRSVKKDDNTYDNTFDKNNFKVALSKDGSTWTDIEYTTTGGESTPYWVTATSNFTLKEAVSELYIRFTANESSVYRLDDMKLETGVGGTVVDLNGGSVPPKPEGVSTIAEVIAGANGAYTIEGTVVGVNGRSFLVNDNTGIVLVYLGWDKATSAPVVSYDAAVGQKVKVSGTTTTYSKLKQFSETGLTIEKVSDGTYTQPNPNVLDGAGFDAYAAAAPVVEYIQYTGTLSISGFYYNIAVEGTTLQGSLAYPADGSIDASLDGQQVIVTGYAMGMTNQASMLSTLAISVVAAAPSTDPAISKVDPASLSFVAAGASHVVKVTTVNTDATYTITAAASNAQFTATVNGNDVTVVAAENTTDAAITGTLTINLMKGTETVDTKTVGMTQAAPASGNTFEVTLTYDEIAKMTNQAYGPFDFTNSFGKWTGKCAITATGKDSPFLQFNFNSDAKKTAFNSCIIVPQLEGKAQKIVIELSDKTFYPRAVGVYAADYTYAEGATPVEHEAAALAASAKTTENSKSTLTIDVSMLDLNQFSLFPIGGAVYIQSITITCSK